MTIDTMSNGDSTESAPDLCVLASLRERKISASQLRVSISTW